MAPTDTKPPDPTGGGAEEQDPTEDDPPTPSAADDPPTRRARRRWLTISGSVVVAIGAVLLIVGTAIAFTHRRSGGSSGKPNIVVITTDDQTYAQLQEMPKTRALLGQRGTTYTNAFVNYSECCPSRTTFLTGQTAHNHGVRSSIAPNGGYSKFTGTDNTLPVWLQSSGYYTAIAGKYLNQYGVDAPARVDPGWDDWFVEVDPSTYSYWGYTVNNNGTMEKAGTAEADYSVDATNRRIVDVINRQSQGDAPLFAWWTPLAPHLGTRTPDEKINLSYPAPRHAGSRQGRPVTHTPAFNEADVDDKPAWIRDRPLMNDAQITGMDDFRRMADESLQAVDDGVEAIVNALTSTGMADNTVIIFTSDNGEFYGEHRVQLGKVLPYDESIHVPLIITGGPWAAGATDDQMVSNTDLAPTILDLAGVAPGRPSEGWSLVPGRHSVEEGRLRAVGIESGPGGPRETFYGFRTMGWKYVEWSDGEVELYDMKNDPFELVNRAKDPAYALKILASSQLLSKLKVCKGEACIGRDGANSVA